MARVFNFSAGPSVLPEVVLKQAADEMQKSAEAQVVQAENAKAAQIVVNELIATEITVTITEFLK